MKRSPSNPLDDDITRLLGEQIAPAELSSERRDNMRERMLQQARDEAPSGTRTIRARQEGWRTLAPLIEVNVLSVDEQQGVQTLMMRVSPGGVIPSHRHLHQEELFVVAGECSIGTRHRLFAGDMHIAAAGSLHEAITTSSGVTLLLRTDYPSPEYVV